MTLRDYGTAYVLIFCSALTACSDDGSPGGEAGSPAATAESIAIPIVAGDGERRAGEACELVTAAQASNVLGMTVKLEPTQDYGICTYEVDGELTTMFMIEWRDKNVDNVFEMAQSMDPDHEEIDGLGEKGFYMPLMGHSITFVEDGNFVVLTAAGLTDDASRRRLEELAHEVANEL